MKKLILITVFFVFFTIASWAQKLANLWYLPTMTTYQAENLSQYDLLVIDPEILVNHSSTLDEMMANNPKLEIFLYINPTEIFEPMWPDKPWSIKLLEELKTKKSWWLYHPNGEKLGIWAGMKTLDMRANCPEIDGQRYWQWILDQYLKLLTDKRISGCLIDNAWGDDRAGIQWLANYNSQKGLDLNGDKKADTNWQEINLAWAKGFHSFFGELRKVKDNLCIIANPGNLSYREVDGKQFENFPYPHHHLGGPDWEVNMMIAKKYKIAIINPREEDFLLGAITALMLDNAYLAIGQNQLYHDYYNLNLGKALGKTKEISRGIWFRQFEKGSIFIDTNKGNKAWVEYKDRTKREK
ncbi:MAG TPA: putative glycoside hydrolase [bacterium]|jgi:hypothetical protein|nr:putative glycoside hydrolase [bacterium]